MAHQKGHIPWNKGKHHSEETLVKLRIARAKRVITDATRKKMSIAFKGERHPLYGKHHTDESRKKMSDSRKGKPAWNKGKKLPPLSEEHKLKISQTHTGRKRPIETGRKISAIKMGHEVSIETREKLSEINLGGFWYGNVRYQDRIYCELWNPNLWKRIDAFWEYKSVLSGKTKEDNGGHALSRHHVYWQPKACCEWDEDAQGYYAMLNLGTAKNPSWYKYYIPGDPNKFVLLTKSEHGIVRNDKLKWIKIFEDLIEMRGGKSYLTNEEYNTQMILERDDGFAQNKKGSV